MTGNLRDGLAKTLCCPNGCEADSAAYDPCRGQVGICQAKSFAASADAALAYIAAQGYLRDEHDIKLMRTFKECVAIAAATGHVMTRMTDSGVEIVRDIWKVEDDK